MNNNNKKEIKLHELIYNEVEPYLIYDCSFNRLLELSLINKKSFYSIQYYLKEKQNSIKFYPNINGFINYVGNKNNEEIDNDNDNDNRQFKKIKRDHEIVKNEEKGIEENQNISYKYKLIQYKEIKELYLKSFPINFPQIKNQLNKYCDQLKIVYFDKYRYINTLIDPPNCEGFYKFNKISAYWSVQNPPYSDIKEKHNEESFNNYTCSFEFLKKLNPKKFKFSTAPDEYGIELENFDNVLKCKLLESLKFDFHNTPYKFALDCLNSKSPQFKELTFRLNDGDEIENLFIQSNIKNNQFLKKLILKQSIEHSDNIKDPSKSLNQLIGNQTLQVLGLELYKIKEHNSLSPLLKIPSIETLWCDVNSIESFLLHCNKNSNIKKLRVLNDQFHDSRGNDDDENDEDSDQDEGCDSDEDDSDEDEDNKKSEYLIKLFSKFFKENKSLETLQISFLYGIGDKLIKELKKSDSNLKLIYFSKEYFKTGKNIGQKLKRNCYSNSK